MRRRGAGAATVALAGSTRRSADPAVDDHLGEQLLRSAQGPRRARDRRPADRAQAAPRSVWVEAEPEPRAGQGREHPAPRDRRSTPSSPSRCSAIELAGLLHPTPAVGGEPARRRWRRSPSSRSIDRGWYAGPVGWMDAAEDGEFCVALRSALLRDRTAHLFAGAGIVADSDPAAELAETELKLEALLPLLG